MSERETCLDSGHAGFGRLHFTKDDERQVRHRANSAPTTLQDSIPDPAVDSWEMIVMADIPILWKTGNNSLFV